MRFSSPWSDRPAGPTAPAAGSPASPRTWPGCGEAGRFLLATEVRFRLEPGETREIPVVLPRGGVVEVEYPSARVEVGEGAFLTPLRLRGADGALLRITARRIEPGRAEFRGVPPGPVTVEVGRRDGSTVEKQIDVRAGAVTRVVVGAPSPR